MTEFTREDEMLFLIVDGKNVATAFARSPEEARQFINAIQLHKIAAESADNKSKREREKCIGYNIPADYLEKL